MASFFRNPFASKQEDSIKEAILNNLAENAREVENISQQQGINCLELCEATTMLCTSLEAFFLHGLKDSLLWQTLQVIAGDEKQRPEPSFWSPLMVFLHKEVLQQIHALRQITSDIGYCRAWVRLTLNDSLFSSYLNNMGKQRSAFSPYYKRHALIMDNASLEMASRLMQGLEANIEFKLPINSSLLNHWSDLALQLSALWTPALKISPPINAETGDVTEAEAAAEEPSYPTPQPVNTNVAFRDSIANSPFKTLNERPISKNEDFLEQVDEILKKPDKVVEPTETGKGTKVKKKKPNLERLLLKNTSASLPTVEELSLNDDMPDMAGACSTGPGTGSNSLAQYMQSSWKSGDDDCHNDYDDDDDDDDDDVASSSTPNVGRSDGPHCVRQMSYNTLLIKMGGERKSMIIMTPEIEGTENRELLNEALEENDAIDDFELVPESNIDQEMLQQLCKIPHESGLDAQGFVCKSCQNPLLGGYGNFRVCGFTGHYHCANCMQPEAVFIPARIIYNWDFRKYFISQDSSVFLKEIGDDPLIDLQTLNPQIYNVADAMAELQSLRIRLNFIRAYMYTCSPSSSELLEKCFFGRKYLYEEIHLYSVNDLSLILRGTLTQQLHKAYKMGEAHILKCLRCSQKGFICEVCKSSRVLYPFHIDTTFRCEDCGAVFHPKCLNENQPCPKCERRRKRIESEHDSLNDI